MNETDGGVRAGGPSSHIETQRFSSSLPPPFWGHIPAFGSPSASRNSQLPQSTVDETTLAQRTAAFRQLHGNPRTPARKHRQSKSIGNRSSLSSQPVIVRSYSADVSSASSTKSSSVGKGKTAMDENVYLPEVGEFSIDNILKAIEPDARETLEQIAKICGRSRLSLANEYESHMPPQGEIRASGRLPLDHTLLPVEEASSSNERLAGELPFIAGDEASFDGRDIDPSPTYGLLESLRAAYHYQLHDAPSSSWGDGSSMQVDHDIVRPLSVDDSLLPITPDLIEPPFLHQRTSRSRSANWPLLRGDERIETALRPGEVLTSQPVVSEVLLDARGGHGMVDAYASSGMTDRDALYNEDHYDSYDPSSLIDVLPSQDTSQQHQTLTQRLRNMALLNEAQHWLSWLHTGQGSFNGNAAQSAEQNLRAILSRQAATDSTNVPDTDSVYYTRQ